MATIIDSLLVTLGLDASGFESGKNKVKKGLQDTGNEADKAGAKLKKASKDADEGFKNVAKSAGAFLALIGGTMAIKSFVSNIIESDAALARFSKNLGLGADSISAWSNAAELAGGTANGLQGSMDMLSKAQTELMLTGQSSLIPYFSALGVSMADASGKARPVNDILLDLSDRFSKMDRTTANNMGRMMGIDQGTMNLLLKGREEVELMIRRQKEYGAVTKQQTEAAEKLQKQIIEGKQIFAAFGRELLASAMPAIEKLFQLFSEFGAWIKENKEFVETFLTIMAAGLLAIAAAITPINLTAVAVTGLAAAIALLWNDYQTWKNGGESFIDWGKWEPGFTKAGGAIKWLKDLIEDLVYRAIAAADLLAAVWNRDWKRVKFAAGEFMSGTGKKYGEDAKEDATAKAATQSTAPATTAPVGTVNSKGSGKAGGTEQEKAAMEFFQKKGWSKEQAAGLAANIKRESAFKPDAVGDNGKAYGIAQWHPDRQAEFKKQFGKDIQGSSLEDQMGFMHYELTQGKEKKAGEKLKQATTAQDAAAAVSTHYERPKDTAGEAAVRGQLAATMMGSGAPAALSKEDQEKAERKARGAEYKAMIAEVNNPENYKNTYEQSPADKYAAKAEAEAPSPPPDLSKDHTAGGRFEYNDLGNDQIGVRDNETGIYELANEEQEKAYRKAQGAAYKKQVADANNPENYKGTAMPLTGVAGASAAAQGAGAPQVAQASATPAPNQNSSQVETNIGEVKVYTNASDADGIAKDIGKSMDFTFTSQANYGLT